MSEIARRHDVAPSLLFTWRRRARVPASSAEPAFLPVQIAAEPALATSSPVTKRARKRAGTIEIDLGSGRRLTVGADVDAKALARVIDVLERR